MRAPSVQKWAKRRSTAARIASAVVGMDFSRLLSVRSPSGSFYDRGRRKSKIRVERPRMHPQARKAMLLHEFNWKKEVLQASEPVLADF
jgi:hypothetical protein